MVNRDDVIKRANTLWPKLMTDEKVGLMQQTGVNALHPFESSIDDDNALDFNNCLVSLENKHREGGD